MDERSGRYYGRFRRKARVRLNFVLGLVGIGPTINFLNMFVFASNAI